MTYIRDVHVNFNKVCLDVYEWNKNDYITHFKKIPIYSVDENILLDILTHNYIIKSNTYGYSYRNKKFKALLITDYKNVIALLLDKKGMITKRSLIPYDEERYILTNVNISPLSFNIEKKNKINIDLSTRLETKIKKTLLKEITKLNHKEIEYLYYECFNRKGNYKDMIKELVKSYIDCNEKVTNTSFNFLKLISVL